MSVFAHDASSDARFSDGQSVIGQRVRSVMCVPLRTTDEILGALYVDSLSGAGRFNEADLELLAAIGNQAGVAMHRVRLMGELERLLLDTIKAIAATIDARDGYTHRHSERVAALTARLAHEMGLTAAERQTAELSALLHDVGKIAVPDSILNKPGRLTPEEFAEMQKHPAPRRAHPREHPERDGQGGAAGRAVSPREAGTAPAIPKGSRRGDSVPRPPAGRRRFLRRADVGARVPRGDDAGRGDHAAPRRVRHPLRSRIVEAVMRLHERNDLLPSTGRSSCRCGGTPCSLRPESYPKLQAPNPNHSQRPTAK